MSKPSRAGVWDLAQPPAEPTPRERAVPSGSGELGKKNDHKDPCCQPSKSIAFWHLLRAALFQGTLGASPCLLLPPSGHDLTYTLAKFTCRWLEPLYTNRIYVAFSVCTPSPQIMIFFLPHTIHAV